MLPAVFVLTFVICGVTPDPAPEAAGSQCEPGEVRTTTCERGEAFIRAGLRPRQILHVLHCFAE